MNIEIEFIKGIPIEQIESFEDKVVYKVAVETREMTKGLRAYPYLTGTLERTEIQEPIVGNNKEYSLGAGVDYAKYVYQYNDANWTNPSTEAHWYHNIFNRHSATILSEAVSKTLKEFNK